MKEFTVEQVRGAARAYVMYCDRCYDIEGVTPDFDTWWEEYNKPAKKIIDMAHFIRSGIDCEFWHSKAYPNQSIISKLDPLTKIGDTWFYSKCKTPDGSTMNGQWKYCRPRMSHKMFHNGGECPIPSGFRGHVYLRDGQVGHHGETTLATWSHDNDSFDIIGYEILGLADGWAYPWESE